MSEQYDVIISGGGPVGLFVACELRLAGASVLVLERELKPNTPWKIAPLGRRGLFTASLEHFYRRGLLARLVEPEVRPAKFQKTDGLQFGGHFAGITFDANKLDLESDRFKYVINGPSLMPTASMMEQIERTLADRAESLGVTIRRGIAVTKIAALDDDGVTVEAGEGHSFSGKWLVGCDGGRSTVRKAAGFDFVGTEPKFTGYAVKCDFDHPEKLGKGFLPTKNGMYMVMPQSLYLIDFDGGAFSMNHNPDEDITREHLQALFEHISGITDVNITTVHIAASFTDRTKQATTYRRGRVLLAGDAAHIHPPLGAQGLQIGLADAMNLGWKLAATIRQEQEYGSLESLADLALLDTYENERKLAATSVIDSTRAQVVSLQPDPFGAAVHSMVRDVVNTTDGANLFIERFWGLSLRYSLGDSGAHSHPVVGRSVPDFELHDGSRLGSKMEGGKGLLVSFEDDAALKKLVLGEKYGKRIDFLGAAAKDTRGLRALLARPDGVVAWATEDGVEPDMDALKAALERWFRF
ncbi:Uu.00g044210.m01.CDS01 [Anthostomella pinea]|uniref:Uu.00g044210.m01.CDS01 n=1 Tax=Anthostomella pinea TaxID=933095 RepID=A0AAI8VB13_9PEZI|nr:Uu.00g044210.m01.CDS01 [Anthostomella pinea]